jgi:ribosome-associated protein
VLLDYIDVVVHVFAQEEREYYDLERLWRDAPRLGWNATDQAAAGSLD